MSTAPHAAARTKKVLLIAANPATSPLTGWPIGFWWAELTHPWWTFREAGYEVEVRSPNGGAIVGDVLSDPEDPSGYSAHDVLSLGCKKSPTIAAQLQSTKSIADVVVHDYDAIFLAGGQSPMVTFRGNTALARLVADFHAAGKVIALVCHATCVLLDARHADGSLLVHGKTWTGFADAEERLVEATVGKRVQPFWIEQEARKLEGTNFVTHQPFREFAVRDGLLVTGQQQNSGAAAARLVIEALGR
ncbi:MAG: type 1 glutamine amidotransferase domain-containing protein [Planctomycetota bacterium]